MRFCSASTRKLVAPSTCSRHRPAASASNQQNAVLHHRKFDGGELFAACDLVITHVNLLLGYPYPEFLIDGVRLRQSCSLVQ